MNDQFSQLVAYVKQQLSQGVPEEHIRHVLLQHQWPAALIDQAFMTAKMPPQPVYNQTAQHSYPAQGQGSFGQAAPASVHAWGQPTANMQPQPQAHPQHAGQAWAPQKYKLFRAVGDAIRAMRANIRTFLLAVVVSYAIAGVSLILLSLLLKVISDKMFGGVGPLFFSLTTFLTMLIVAVLIYTVWYVCMGAFALSATSLAIYDGGERRKGALGATLSTSFARLGRVVLTDLLVWLVAVLPLIGMAVLIVVVLMSGNADSTLLLLLQPLLMLGAVIWLYIAMVRFALAPFVALFEPAVPVTKTLQRSRHLLKKGGQWFLLKGVLLLLAIFILLALVTGQTLAALADTTNILTNIFLVIVSIIANGVLVMLYRNRSMVKGTPTQ